MKVKKILPIYLFLSLFLVSQSANANPLVFRSLFAGIGKTAVRGGRVMSRTGSVLTRSSRVGKSWGKLGKEVLIAGAAGVVANEAYEYYEQSKSAHQSVFSPNYQPNANDQSKEHYLYVNTIKLGDPDLVW